jgi:lipoprotein-anchoring transpeptidase ErfK/SrfK
MTIGNRRARLPGAVGKRHKVDGMTIRPYHWAAIVIALLISSCAAPDTRHHLVVSTRDQKMALLDKNNLLAVYPVSTSKFGLGDWPGSRFTPLGQLQIAEKIGGNAPPGAVFKDRRRTGEIVRTNSPGRDPIVTRILWLRGLEAQNARAFSRDIYIHGTPEEWKIGSPASYGCIRMRSGDIIHLFDIVGVGAAVTIVNAPLTSAVPALVSAHSMDPSNPAPFVMR